MNIVEAILKIKKKYTVLISSLMWWKYFSVIVDALARDFNFNVVKLTNDDYKTLNETMRNATGGTFIVGASFPTENIDFPIDYHIHIKL